MQTKGIYLKITPCFFLTAAALYYVGGIRLLLAVMLTDAVHELGHIAVFCLIGAIPLRIKLSGFGAALDSPALSNGRDELLTAAAGPAFGLLFAVLCMAIHTETSLYYAAAAILSTAFNLLPALPLDGGRILEILLSGSMTERACTVILRISGMLSALFILYVGINLHCIAAIIAAVYLAVLVNFPQMR